MDYKIVLGVLATLVGFIGYFPYIRNVLRGITKPHFFSWLAWGILEAIAFIAQTTKGGGSGAWVTGAGAGISLFIASRAWKNRREYITTFDSVAFAGAIVGILLWQVSQNPLLAIVSVVIADALAFVPTYRKGFHKPNEETLIEYFLSCVKWVIAIFALESLNITTWLYPASLIITNGGFVVMALLRRKKLFHRKI